MLGIADSIHPGTGLFVLFDEFLVTASLVSLLWIAPRISWTALLAATVLVALPQFVLYQGIVWKDVLFADSALAGFVVLACAGAGWRNHTARWVLVCFSFLLFVLAALARQNGILAIPFAVLALIFMTRRQGERWSSAFVVAVAGAALSSTLVLVASAK